MTAAPPPSSKFVQLWPFTAEGGTPVGLFAHPPLCQSYEHAELKAWFDELVSHLSTPARVLDLAAGTQAATEALRSTAQCRERPLVVETVNVGEPPLSADRPCPVLAAGHFQGVVSIFGLERLNRLAVLPWLRQILAPGGVVSALILATESPMVRDCLDYIRVFDAVVAPWWQHHRSVENSLATVVEQLDRETHRTSIREEFAVRIKQLSDWTTTTETGAIDAWDQLQHHVERWRARLACTMDAGSVRQFVREAHFAGLGDACVVPFELRGALFGWHWTAERHASART